MPTPQPDETEEKFVSRCIPIVLNDGTAKDDKQAAAVCYSLFRGKEKEAQPIDLGAQLEALNGVAADKAVKNEVQDDPFGPLFQLISVFTSWVRERVGTVDKEGKRNSSRDGERLQQAHDLLVENGAQCTLKVYKGSDGKLRWVTISSTAFKDRDGEIVSTKALEDDVVRADKDNEYGPLRWWHVPGVDLGKCDFNAMSGKMLIESGTFDDEAVGQSIKEAADDLAVSIGFQHPPTEPDAAGVFHHIRRFERSLLPADKASNLYTQLSVAKEQDNMTLLKEKLDELVKRIGKGPAEAIVNKADQTEKAGEAAGTAFKETPAPETTSPPAAPETAKAAEPDGDEGYGKMLEKCMKSIEALGARMDAHEKSHKEAHEAEAAEVAKATKERDDQMLKLVEAVNELMGETPRAAKGFRPTQEGPIRQEEPGGPQPNETFKGFIDFMVSGKPSA